MNIWPDFADGIHGVLQSGRHSVSCCRLGKELNKADRISLLETDPSTASFLVSVFKKLVLTSFQLCIKIWNLPTLSGSIASHPF
jgi:hypothetical protein